MREAGHGPPNLAVRAGAVVVTFALPLQTPGKTAAAILQLLKEAPELTIPELAHRLGKSERAIERAVRKLRQSDRLVRIGPDKGGHWKVIE